MEANQNIALEKALNAIKNLSTKDLKTLLEYIATHQKNKILLVGNWYEKSQIKKFLEIDDEEFKKFMQFCKIEDIQQNLDLQDTTYDIIAKIYDEFLVEQDKIAENEFYYKTGAGF